MLLIPAGGHGLSKGRKLRGAQRIQGQAWAGGGGEPTRKKSPAAASFIFKFDLTGPADNQPLLALHKQLGRAQGTCIVCHIRSRACVLGVGRPPSEAWRVALSCQHGTWGLGGDYGGRGGKGRADRLLVLKDHF